MKKLLPGLILFSVAASMTGCAGNMKALTARVAELEMKYQSVTRTNSAMTNRVDDVENKVLLLQDEVETQRLVGMRGGASSTAQRPAVPALPVVRLAPSADGTGSTDISSFDYVSGSDSSEPERGHLYDNDATADDSQPEDYGSANDDGGDSRGGSQAPVNGGSLNIDDSYSGIDDMGRVIQSTSRPSRGSAPARTAPAARTPRPARTPPANRGLQAARALEEYKAAYDLYLEGRTGEARLAFVAFVDKYPAHAYADNARYWVGECWYDVRDYEKARVEFMKVVSDYPDGNKVPDAMVKVGLCDQNLGRNEDARRMYDAVILTYPDSDAAAVAMRFIGNMQ